ncbi:MAG: hypothetical protein LIO46_02335 [Clostridiales bacterium]|nr:hypothetical protein [Clostridiales bacterium]
MKPIQLFFTNYPKYLHFPLRPTVYTKTTEVTRMKYGASGASRTLTLAADTVRLLLRILPGSTARTTAAGRGRMAYRAIGNARHKTLSGDTARMACAAAGRSVTRTLGRLYALVYIFHRWEDRRGQTWGDVKHMTGQDFYLTIIE